MTARGFGVYLHWPFCAAKCPYCDFNSHVRGGVDHDRWATAFEAEIQRVASLCPDQIVTSIYFGGGTPSLMAPESVDRIISAVRNAWRSANDLEITLEANPGSVETGRFAAFRQAGVNRVSLGVQALNDADLKALGRIHSVAEALRALDIARSTFERVSFDLIYARQNQSLSCWRDELVQALSFKPDHLSLYQLTIEPGTMFHRRAEAGALPGLPEEEVAVDQFELTQELCVNAGLPAYEVSNHARLGQESQHNLIYWRGLPYAGIGPGAHGRLLTERSWIATEGHRMPEAWLTSVEEEGHGDHVFETVELKDRLNEILMMGLRLNEPLNVDQFAQYRDQVVQAAQNIGDEWLIVEGDQLTATAKGRLLLNHILVDILL